jgi:hypothetical protein
LKPEGAARVEADLEGIEGALRGLCSGLRPFLGLTWIPCQALRENLLAADEFLRVGAELAQAGQVAGSGLRSIAEATEARYAPTEGQETRSMSEALFTGLAAARPQFTEAAKQVGRAYEGIKTLETDDLWGPLPGAVSKLRYYLHLGSAGLEAAAAAPALLGETHPVHYLIVPQNSDELRATGGFITGIGLATIERGKISELTIKDSYDFDKFTVDHPFAPEPMQRYMGIILWATRDGNWSPDFPTAAQTIEDLYHLEHSTQITGVVAFDMFALKALVEAIGPLYIEEYEDHIDSDNVLQKAREYWAPTLPEGMTWQEYRERGWRNIKEEWWFGRKDFMGMLAEALMAKLQAAGQADQLGGLVWTIKRAVDEKHLLLYFHDPSVQELLEVAGWDGTLGHRQQTDYLLALDTNMGYNKVNLNVEKLIDYEVMLDQDANPRATLTITYHNRSPAQAACIHKPRVEETYDLMAQDCYWNYLRVYVPSGSQLLAIDGVTETETLTDEEGKTAFSTFFVVPANESRTVRFTYGLPGLTKGEYRLLVQKQAGTEAVPLKVRIILPRGVHVSSAQPEPQSRGLGVLSYDMDLRRDRMVSLTLR